MDFYYCTVCGAMYVRQPHQLWNLQCRAVMPGLLIEVLDVNSNRAWVTQQNFCNGQLLRLT